MKIVVLDGYTENPGDLSWDELEKLGDLTVYDRTPIYDQNEIIRRIGNADAVYTNKTPISAYTIDNCPQLRFIGVLATGYDVVDYAYARKKAIPVTNVPAYGVASVSQFAIALLLELCHHIGHHNQAVHAGRWESAPDWCFWDFPLIELAGKTLGIIGFGRIGQATGRIATALGMKVLAYDKVPCDAGAQIAQYTDLDALFETADVIVLHCPLLPETEGIINRETIGKMKDGVLLINNSRGPLVNEQDLADALQSGKVAAAAVDVVSREPIQSDNPLLAAPNCIITPHISWAPKESRARIMCCAAENLKAFLLGKPIHVVNA